MNTRCAHALLAVLFTISASIAAAVEPQEVTFSSGGRELHGFVFRPAGSGPFPAVLYNHGSERRPGAKPEIGNFFAANGYVLFVPHRRGQGRSPGPYIMDTLGNTSVRVRGSVQMSLLGEQNQDVIAALDFLKKLPYVDAGRIAVAGCSFGGIETLLTAERDVGLRAAVAFAPGAETWNGSPEIQERLIAAVRNAKVPVFLIQAENDYDLTPTRVLSKEMEQAGKPHKAVIYPRYGETAKNGHGDFCFRAPNVWGREVLAFLAAPGN
jgi:dienelactone hydrolase